jgi:hypothetical protein
MGMEAEIAKITWTPQSGLPGVAFADEGISLKRRYSIANYGS